MARVDNCNPRRPHDVCDPNNVMPLCMAPPDVWTKLSALKVCVTVSTAGDTKLQYKQFMFAVSWLGLINAIPCVRTTVWTFITLCCGAWLHLMYRQS